jgi:imidazolonepropionase-like amidohydrolase
VLAHSTGGLTGGANERLANVPYVTVHDAVDPSSKFFEECLRNGVGSIHVIPGNGTLIGGLGMVVRPYGKTVEDMAVRTKGGMKLSLLASGGSRMTQIRQLRRALQDAVEYRQDYDRRKAEFDKEKAAGATQKESFEEPDAQKKPLLDLLAGKTTAWLYVPSAAEVAEVGRLKETYGLNLVLVLGKQCHKAAAAIVALDLPVVLEEDCTEFWERNPETDKDTLVSPAKVFADAGIRYALGIAESTTSSQRYPWWQIATAMRNGVPREFAIASLTTEPARILGLDEVGSIEVGKVANLQILSGDPLLATTWVETVLLEGEVVYERATDRRLSHLFGETKN